MNGSKVLVSNDKLNQFDFSGKEGRKIKPAPRSSPASGAFINYGRSRPTVRLYSFLKIEQPGRAQEERVYGRKKSVD